MTTSTSEARRLSSGTVGAALLAVLTGCAFIGRKGLWLDESYSLTAASRPFGDLVDVVTQYETNMAPYYLALHGWLEVGRSEATVRLLSVPFFVLSVVALVAVARRLTDGRTAVLAGVLLAVNEMAVAYAQEARAYSMLLLCATLTTLLHVEDVLRPRRSTAAGWAVLSVFSLYVHYFAALVVLVHLVALLLLPDGPRRLRRLLPAVLSIGVLAGPLAGFALGLGTGPLGSALGASPLLPGRLLFHYSGSLVLAGVLALAVAVGIVRSVQRGGRPGSTDPLERWRHGLPVVWLLLPPTLLLAASVLTPVWNERYLIVSLPPFVLLVAVGLRQLAAARQRRAAVGTVLAVSAATLGLHYAEEVKYDADWRGASAHVAANMSVDDGVWVLPGSHSVNLHYYLRDDFEDLSLADDGFEGRIHPLQVAPQTVRTRVALRERVWVLTKTRTGRSAAAKGAQERWVDSVLSARHQQVQALQFGENLQLRLYERRG